MHQPTLYPPVVSNDGGGQHAGEQPTKLSQGVKQRPVVRFHVRALNTPQTQHLQMNL